jgi:hypothetical protein
MAHNEDNKDKQIENDIRNTQEFSMKNAISRIGGNMLNGESPTPRLVQAQAEVSTFIEHKLPDATGALIRTLITWVNNDIALSQLDQAPLAVLKEIISHILADDSRLHEFVRQVDMTYGALMHERPHFQSPGQEPHPDDVYTHEGVAEKLRTLLYEIENTK